MVWLALFSAGVRVAAVLPAAWLHALARGAGFVASLLPLAPRRRLRRNLARVLGVPAGHPRLRRALISVYQTQALNYVDLMRAPRVPREEIERRYTQDGPGWEALFEAVRERRGCVLVTAHFGRYELLNHFLALHKVPVTLLVERQKPPRLYELVGALRSHTGIRLIPHDAGMRPWLRALSAGDVLVLFAEWDPSGHGVPVRFFGAPARFPPGPAFLALRANVPLFVGYDLPGNSEATGRVYLDAPLPLTRTGDMDADVREATQRIASHFERFIGMSPGRWVMFHEMWPGVSEYGASGTVKVAAPS